MLLEAVVAIVLVASVVAIQFPFPTPPLDLARDYQAASFLRPLVPGLFQPISPHAVLLTDLQLGRVLWVAAALGCLLAWWRGKWEARLLAAATGCILPLMVPVPQLSTSLMLAVPDWLYGISSISLWMRLLPNFSLLAVFALFLGLASRPPRRRGTRWLAGVALASTAAGMVFWDVPELQKLRWRAHLSVYPPEATAAFYREDTAQLYSYSYDNLPRPGYLLDGPADYHLESRLLRASDLRLLPEPLLAAPSGEDITLAAAPDPYSPTWLHLTPSLHLGPRERLILRFSFFSKPYHGTLILQGPNGFYRNYYLPSAGLHDQSFGVAPGRPKTLAVWNSLDEPQDISLIFLLGEPVPNFGDFARVRLQRYRPEDLQIQTLGLTPYRARVRSAEPAFLETPRVFIPGYRARVDGRPAAVTASPEHLAMIRLAPGLHEVTLSFQPTWKMQLALSFSGLGWLGVGIWSAGRFRRPIRTGG